MKLAEEENRLSLRSGFSFLSWISFYTQGLHLVLENFLRQTEMLRGLRNGRQSFTSKTSVQNRLRLVTNKKYLTSLFSVYAKRIGGSGSLPSNKRACHNWQLCYHSWQIEPRIKWSRGSKVTSPPLQTRVEAHWQKLPLLPEQGCAMVEHKDVSIMDCKTSTFFQEVNLLIFLEIKKFRCCLVQGRLATQTLC